MYRILALSLGLIASTASAKPVDYIKDILPIFDKHCVSCHTTDDAEGGLALDSHASLMAGGETGRAITPGASASSKLIALITGRAEPAMPPEGEPQLDADQIALLRAWIDQGAPGPDGPIPIARTFDLPKIPPREGLRLPVTAVAISPTQNLQAVARFGSVEIRTLDQRVVSRIENLSAKVNAIQFSRDGDRILIASGVTGAYGRAAIYESRSGTLVSEFLGHRDTLYCAAFSPSEEIIATAGYDRDIVLWDVEGGEKLRTLRGHNGAIFDLAFSPRGDVLVSACADETAKVWHVESGLRLDTLGQPEGEVWAVAITPDAKHILAASADSRLRVWRLLSTTIPKINPLVATRFVDESPLTQFALTSSGDRLVLLSEAGNLKVLDSTHWNQLAVLESVGESGSDLAITADDSTLRISLMDGRLVTRSLQNLHHTEQHRSTASSQTFLVPQSLSSFDESKLRGDSPRGPLDLARFSEVSGALSVPGEVDQYRWQATQGEIWAIDVDAADKSLVDPAVNVLDANGDPVLRARLQAVRDTYFTFRGKDSSQAGDFRLFAWLELNLNDYLYAAGEVTRLWMHPRGPDSGFDVYPGEGKRWTYFGTTHQTHALGEPAYIVRQLQPGESPLANGLPVFDIPYQNDDDTSRQAGKNSRLIFTAPASGSYTLAVRDTSGAGGKNYRYKMRIRAAAPSFTTSVAKINKPIHRGSGREFTVRIDRTDGFEGPVSFDFDSLPVGLISNTPLTIEAGQRYATGTIWASPNAKDLPADTNPVLTATGLINGTAVIRDAGTVGKLSLAAAPKTTCSIQPIGTEVPPHESWTLTVKRGQTAIARVVLNRRKDFTAEVSMGKEKSGRNATHGVYVDNIGLNGLLVLRDANEREFSLTADRNATPGKRSFFLTANVDGGVTSHPIIVEVLP